MNQTRKMQTVDINCVKCGYTANIFDIPQDKDDIIYSCPSCDVKILIWKDFATGKYRTSNGAELDYILNPEPTGRAKH